MLSRLYRIVHGVQKEMACDESKMHHDGCIDDGWHAMKHQLKWFECLKSD